MSSTRQNGIVTITNDEAYDLAGHMARLADSANVVIPVVNQAAMLALTPYAGMIVARLDLPGVPTMTYTGTVWSLEPAVNITTFGTGWAATNAGTHQPRIRAIGNQVFMYGAVTASSGASVGNILTVPAAYQPPSASTRFIGMVATSNGQTGELALSAGVVTNVSGYGTLSGTPGMTVPMVASWWMD